MKITAKSIAFSAFATAGILVNSIVVANAATMTFDTDPALSPTEASGTWYTDRYAPDEFSATDFDGDSRLKLGLSADDGANDRTNSYNSGFYNTQGRKYDTPGATMASVDMYIDSAWQDSSTGRIGGLWGTGFDSNGVLSLYPTLEFNDSEFQIFDSVNGGYISEGRPAGFTFDEFHNLDFELSGDDLNFYLDGNLLDTLTNNSTVAINNVMLQGHNTDEGIDRSLYFDNLSSNAAVVAAVPEPSSLGLLAIGLVGISLAYRRKRA